MEIDAAHAPDPPAGAGAEQDEQERAHIIEQDVQAAVPPAQGSMEEERERSQVASSSSNDETGIHVEPSVELAIATPPRGLKRPAAAELEEPKQETPTRGQKRSADDTEEEKEAKSPKASPEAAANTSPESGGSPSSTLFQDAWQEQEQITSFEEIENFFSTETDEEIEEIEEIEDEEEDSKPAAKNN